MKFEKLDGLIKLAPYGQAADEKTPVFLDALREVTRFHYDHCGPYKTLCDKRGFDPDSLATIEELPYLPTSIFKDVLLVSIPEDQVFREIRSSATTSGKPSRVGLDKAASRRQTKLVNKTLGDRIGDRRRKFIILDTPETVAPSHVVSARGSTIKSFMFFASSSETVVTEKNGEMLLEEEKLDALLNEAQKDNEPLLILGFTFILYKYVVSRLMQAGRKFDLKDTIVAHIGGWKKLEAEKVTQQKLIENTSGVFGVSPGDVVDVYGFTEQAGLLYPTCEEGRRHVPVWGDVIARDPVSLKPVANGVEGLMQFITPVQTSYPGHSVLTEDVGVITGHDDCPCGRMGKTFNVVGRTKDAEVRGCGDIMAEKFA